MKWMVSIVVGLATGYLGFVVGDNHQARAARAAHQAEIDQLKARHTAEIEQLKIEIPAAAKAAAAHNPQSAYRATYYGSPGSGGRWDVAPDRYPGVSERARVGGGR